MSYHFVGVRLKEGWYAYSHNKIIRRYFSLIWKKFMENLYTAATSTQRPLMTGPKWWPLLEVPLYKFYHQIFDPNFLD